ncbi:MAG: hypothetical protein ACOYBQ_08480 [Fluviibacter sp.]
MARRNGIDWEKVERLYIAGQLTVRQIADKCNIEPSTITRKAKANGWSRDNSSQIRALARAKISMIDKNALADECAQESAQKCTQTIKAAVEQASDVAAGIVVRHRKYLQQGTERAKELEKKLDAFIPTVASLNDLERAARALKCLVDTQARVISLERQAFGLDEKDNDNGEDQFDNLSEDALLAIANELAAQLGLPGVCTSLGTEKC